MRPHRAAGMVAFLGISLAGAAAAQDPDVQAAVDAYHQTQEYARVIEVLERRAGVDPRLDADDRLRREVYLGLAWAQLADTARALRHIHLAYSVEPCLRIAPHIASELGAYLFEWARPKDPATCDVSPTRAGLMSALAPGVGHFVIGDWQKGLTRLGASVGGVVLGVASWAYSGRVYDDYLQATSTEAAQRRYRLAQGARLTGAALVAAGLAAWAFQANETYQAAFLRRERVAALQRYSLELSPAPDGIMIALHAKVGGTR